MTLPSSFFGDITPEQFLAEYWQKKPLLVRGAWPGFVNPLPLPAFLKLASRPDAMSRLLIQHEGRHNWELREGPFAARTFKTMPDSHWTLLIQEVDRLVPAVRDMLGAVDFLPKWRLDDVMISYAANGGGVGAHIDNYDVFLLQGHGLRRWQINTTPVEEEVLIEDIDVSILADFVPDRDWVLEPGDMLYLPPRVAHYGVAEGECMTFSIGCRAPSEADMLNALMEQLLMQADPEARFADPDLQRPASTAALGDGVVAWTRRLLKDLLGDEARLTEMVGTVLSQPRRWIEEDALPEDTLEEALADGGRVRPGSSSQVLLQDGPDGSLLLFAAGEVIELDASFRPLLIKLIEGHGLTAGDLGTDQALDELLDDLYGQGTLVVDA
ncbi:MAG: cupin domain-containing protein [Bacteroidetes bacterium]|nr:cupin domain-containing protein [Bacteroidota bacterium]MDA0875221.1 cupin domain-containing protein [Bacteroidota bacterium]